MNYYNINYISDIQKNYNFPCLGLIKNKWDDYTNSTLFQIYHFKNKSNYKELGYYRIMHNGDKCTTLPSDYFEYLEDDYCSLAMSDDFYYNFYKRDSENITNFLLGLNDISIKQEYFEVFKNNTVFNNSLLRGTSVDFVKTNYPKIIEGSSPIYNQEFAYSCSMDNFSEPINANFSFLPLDEHCYKLPFRINCLIGKNATGKTTILSHLALSLCSKNDESLKTLFPQGRPHFNKVMAISFSMFDKFEHPSDSDNGVNSAVDKNYSYCGFHNENGKMITDKQKTYKLYKPWKTIITKDELFEEWYNLLHFFLDDSQIEKITNRNISNLDLFEKLLNNIYFSSGQYIMLYFITHTIANITEHSLILFDEPEIHLHPNGISIMIKLLYELLQKKDSYAIIATHSPIIVQQIPKKYVSIINRVDDVSYIVPCPIETFGENLSVITREIFDNIDNDSYYKTVLRELAEDVKIEHIKEVFDYNLSLNATLFLDNIKNGNL